MKTVGRYSSSISVFVAALLTACNSPPLLIGAPGAMQQSRAIAAPAHGRGSWMLAEAKREGLVYATGGCSGTCVFSYPSGKLVGSLDAGDPYQQSGDCADAKGDVFISNNTNLVEYSHGGASPIATLDLPGSYAIGCSVDPTTGNLAVVFNGSLANVAIFPNASGMPMTYDSEIDSSYCGYDSTGNLFVDGLGKSNAPALAELPEGGSEFSSISIETSAGWPGQVQWDGKYITYEGLQKGGIRLLRLKIAGSEATVVGTTSFDIRKTAAQSWIQGNQIFIPYEDRGDASHQREIGVWSYPRGGKPTTSLTVARKYHDSTNFQGATFSPGVH